MIRTLVVVLCVCLYSTCTTWDCFNRCHGHDHHTCTDTIFTNFASSLIRCVGICSMSDSCGGVFYNNQTGSCVGCSDASFQEPSTLLVYPGTQCVYAGSQVPTTTPGGQIVNGFMFSNGCFTEASDCDQVPDGNYQSCQGCHMYAACSGSTLHDMPCAANLVWDDISKICDYDSTTCSPVNP